MGREICWHLKEELDHIVPMRNDDPIVSAFQLLGEGVLTSHELVDGELPEEVRPIEKFV